MMNVIKLDEKSADVFWQLRVRLLNELGEIDAETDIDELELATKRYYLSHINDDLISWGIMQDNKIVSIGSLCLFKRLPYKENISGVEGYILNVYTDPAFRRQGFAKRIVGEIKKYAIENRMKRIWLNSSEQGKKRKRSSPAPVRNVTRCCKQRAGALSARRSGSQKRL